MTLGILVNSDKHPEKLAGVVKAALKKGHKVIIFFMDDGCRLMLDGRATPLRENENIIMSLCDLNRKNIGIRDEEVPCDITCGSQYDNALMHKMADKMIVL